MGVYIVDPIDENLHISRSNHIIRCDGSRQGGCFIGFRVWVLGFGKDLPHSSKYCPH